MPYLSALEVCSRRGAIQINVYLTLPYETTDVGLYSLVCFAVFLCAINSKLPLNAYKLKHVYINLRQMQSFHVKQGHKIAS